MRRIASRTAARPALLPRSGYRKTAFPSPEKLSFSLTTARRMPGRRAASSTSASSISSWTARSSNPSGIATPAWRNTLRLPDLVPRWARSGSAPLSGMPSRTASWRSSGVELKTVR